MKPKSLIRVVRSLYVALPLLFVGASAHAAPAIAGALIAMGVGTVASWLIAYGVTLSALGKACRRQRHQGTQSTPEHPQ